MFNRDGVGDGRTENSARDLGILNAVAEALNRSPDVQQALTRALALVADLLGLETGWIWLRDPGTDQFYSAAVQNLPPHLKEPVRMTGHSCWCIDSYRNGKLTPSNIELLECSRLHAAVGQDGVDRAAGLRYHASIPLYFGDKPLGILNVAGPSWRILSEEELRILSTIGYQIGIAIERARLAEEATRVARLEERARIARDIHDTLAQGLTAIILNLESAIPNLESKPERSRKRLESALRMARESLDEARRSVFNLRAAPLEGKPLAEALVALGRTFTSESGVRVRVHAVTDHVLAPHLEVELYRIAQESLANVRRHSGATDVTIRLRTVGDRTRLSIQDNGRGFNPAAIDPERHGILGMRERARLAGGALRIVSGLARGTAVAVVLPRNEEP